MCSLKHFLSVCETSLSLGRYTLRPNASPVNDRDMKGEHQACTNGGQWGKQQYWRLLDDVREQPQVPKGIAVTAARPDMVLCSECESVVYFIELTIHFEDMIEKAFERKKLKYAEPVTEAQLRGWQAHTRPVEIGGKQTQEQWR